MTQNQKGSILFIIILIVLAILAGGGIFTWQYFGTSEEVTAPAELTLDAIQNIKYYHSASGAIFQLKDGSFRDDIPPRFLVTVYNDKVIFGDLNRDGNKDAVVVFVTNYGGSGSFRELAVILNQQGFPHHLTSQDLGDRVIINSLDIDSEGTITIDMIVHGPDEPFCCPTQPKIAKYKLSGDQLIIVE